MLNEFQVARDMIVKKNVCEYIRNKRKNEKRSERGSTEKTALFAFIFIEKVDCTGYFNKLILTSCLECRLE